MSNKYELKNGLRNGVVAGIIAGLVAAVPMYILDTVDLVVLLSTAIVIGAMYGILTSNKNIRPATTSDGITLGIITGLIAFAVVSKTALLPTTETLLHMLQYVLFGGILGWIAAELTNRQQKLELDVSA